MKKSLRRILEEERFKAQEGELAWLESIDFDPAPQAPQAPKYHCLCNMATFPWHNSGCPNRRIR